MLPRGTNCVLCCPNLFPDVDEDVSDLRGTDKFVLIQVESNECLPNLRQGAARRRQRGMAFGNASL